MLFHSGRNIRIVTPGARDPYQVIDGLGQADLFPPLWLGYQGNHYRSLEETEHDTPEDTPDPIMESEQTVSANEFNNESTLSVDVEDSTVSVGEEAISAEMEVITREVEQERQNIQVIYPATHEFI